MLILIYVLLNLATLTITDEMIKTRWSFKVSKMNFESSVRSQNYMYDSTPIKIYGICSTDVKHLEVDFFFIFWQMKCVEDIYNPISNKTLNTILSIIHGDGFSNTKVAIGGINNVRENNLFLQYGHAKFICDGNFNILSNNLEKIYEVVYTDNDEYEVFSHINPAANTSSNEVAISWGTGIYRLFFNMSSKASYSSQVNIDMPLKHGFLSITDYPLVPFSGVMSICYLFISTIWIVMWARAQDHTRKVHVFIGISSVAGGFAFTFSFAALSMSNTDGLQTISIQLLGVAVGEIQMVLTIILLMGISTGYAINRPNLTRLSIVFILLISVSYLLSDLMLIIINLLIYLNPVVLYFVTKCVYIWKASSMTLILIWIGLCSLSTLSQLYSRGHSGKSKLKEFIVLVGFSIFAFLTHLVYTVYLSINLFDNNCHQSLNIEWALPCAHQIYLFILLITLMWLWRPMDEKKTYSFQPLKHVDDEEEDMMDEVAYEDYKLEEL